MSNFISTKVFAKISELDEAIQFDSADEFVVVNDSVTQKITGLNLTESIVSIGNLASKAYVDAVVDGAPELLDTLNELAAALDDDANFATTITALIGTKLASSDFNSYFDTALTSKTTSDVAEDANLYYTQARFDSALAAKTTSDVVEGSNLYWTQARFDSALAAKTTTDVVEGSNLYWTQARFDSALGSKSTSDTSEGSNLYYTQARFESAFADKTTTALVEGDNLYWTQARFDSAFADKTTTALVEGDNLYWTQARFDAALGSKSTSDTTEGSNLYYTQARFDAALAAKTTADVAEGANLYFTEQRVLDIIATQTTNKLVNGSVEVVLNESGALTLPADPTSDNHAATKGYVDNQLNSFESDRLTNGILEVVLQSDGTVVLPADPTSDNHAATKGYVDNQVDYVVAGQGFATLGYVEDAIGDALDNYKSDRLVSGSKEVVLQSNGYIRLVNGAQLYDYGSGTGNGYGITDAASGTYIGYDPSDTLGALHMDSYTGGNIRIRTTTLPNTYKDWLFESNGALTLPAVPTSANHAATKGYVDDAIVAAELDGGEF